MTSAPASTRSFSDAARSWLRTTSPVAARSTAASFVIGLVVAALLVIVHGLDSPSGELVLGLPGLRFHTGLDEGSYALPLLLVALAGWVLLTSLSRLVVARQVRGYLRALPESRGLADGGTEPDHDADVMAERLMLEAYLSIASSAARAVAMTCALAVILPWQATCGVVICWLVAGYIGRRRFHDGREISQGLTHATRQARTEPGASAHDRLVDVIYERDTRMHRLTVPQAAALLASVLALVVVPAWLARSGGGATTAVLVVLLWLQAIQAGVTESGGLGWRAQIWFDQHDRPRSGSAGPAGRTAGATGDTGEAAERAGVMWWSVQEAPVTLVAVVGRRPSVGSDLVVPLADAAVEARMSLALLRPGYANRLSPALAAGLGIGGPVVVLGLAGPNAGAPISRLVDDTGGVLVRQVSAEGAGTDIDGVRLDVDDVRALASGGLLAEAIRMWADATIPTTQAQERTEALLGEAIATTAARDDEDDSLGFEA